MSGNGRTIVASLFVCISLVLPFSGMSAEVLNKSRAPNATSNESAVSSVVSIQDRNEILELISQYSYSYDSKDLDTFLNLMTPDIVWEAYSEGDTKALYKFSNKDELRKALTPRIDGLKQKGIQTRHFQTNTVMKYVAGGAVDASTMLVLMWQMPNSKETTIVVTGVYKDMFVKVDGKWVFAKRTFFADHDL